MTLKQAKALNSTRAVLILGVVMYHAARVFDTSPFYVKAPTTLDSMWPVVLFGTLVGMPLFFAFAGFSLWVSLDRRGGRGFLRDRVVRLMIPFIAGIVLLVPVQIFVERRLGGEDVSYLQSFAQFLDVHPALAFPIPITGTWFDPAHLWFLGYLFAFTVLLFPFLVWLRRRPHLPSVSRTGAAAIWGAALLGVIGAEALLGTEAAGGWNRWSFLVFLVLGVCIATQPEVGKLVARRWRLTFALFVASFAALAVFCHTLGGQFDGALNTSGALEPMLWRAGKGVTMMLLLIAVVGSVVQRQSVPRRRPLTAAMFSYLEPISLPIYIVHQSILVILAYWTASWSVPAGAQWLAIVILTVGLSILFIELAARSSFGRLMLGVKRGRRAPVPSTAQLPPRGAPKPDPLLSA